MEERLVDEIIQELIAIEDQCAVVTQQSAEEQAALAGRIAQEAKRIDAEMDERIAQEMKVINEAAMEEARQKMMETSSTAQRMFAAVETAFEERADEWRDEIFNLVVGKAQA